MFKKIDLRMSVHACLINALANDKDAVLFWNLFTRSTLPPLDFRVAAAALRGANQSIRTACTLLSEPNSQITELLAKVEQMQETFMRIQEECQVQDLGVDITKTLTSYSQWRLIAEAADTVFDGSALQFGTGIELALALTKDRPMAKGWTKFFRLDKSELSTTPAILQAALFDAEAPLKREWTRRLKQNMAEFAQLFDSRPPPPTRPRTFDERVRENWRSKAAFATHSARSAVLDDRCLSLNQFRRAMQQRFDSPDTRDEYVAALYFVGFSGLTPNLIAQIPVVQTVLDMTVCRIEFVDDGVVLVRDFECLASDAAKPVNIDGIPASSILRTPLPQNISSYLRTRISEKPNATHLGMLLPKLMDLNSRGALYGTTEEPTPSWARLRPTIGRILRQEGMDSLLVALLTADLSHSAKSKLYYATVSQTEINAAAARAYSILGFESLCILDRTGIAFGSQVTPTAGHIRLADEALVREAEKLRPGRNSSRTQQILFHNAYCHAIAFRIMVLLALRETSEIPLPAMDDDKVTYLAEKSSARRTGGMAAILPALLAEQLRLYQVHCIKFYRRLTSVSPTPFETWLKKAISDERYLELRTCSVRDCAQPIRTADVLGVAHLPVKLAPDFGRKFMENRLRERGIRTADIDRVMRHEVAGQETSAGVSDGSEVAWCKRVRPVLDAIAIELFGSAVPGIAKELK